MQRCVILLQHADDPGKEPEVGGGGGIEEQYSLFRGPESKVLLKQKFIRKLYFLPLIS